MSETGTAVASRPDPQPKTGGAGRSGRGRGGRRAWLFSRPAAIGLYVRQVLDQLRKVIWPTRKELVTYTVVVIVFVTVMTTITELLDLGFAKLVLAVFG